MGMGRTMMMAHPHVSVGYISVDVVPLVDYWPPFVRDAFAEGVWRFRLVGKEGEGVGLEIREFSFEVMEWCMEMQWKRECFVRGMRERKGGEDGGVGGEVGEGEGEKGREMETETETETGRETEAESESESERETERERQEMWVTEGLAIAGLKI